MFQLIYLTFTAPRADPVAFGVLNDQLKVTLANQQAHAGHGVRRGARCRAEPEPSAGAAADAGARRPDEPRQVARVLQGPLRRCERLHLRVRRELRSRDHEAARGALPGQPSGPPPERGAEGRRHASAGGRRREAGEERHRTRGARSASCSAGRSRTTRCIAWSPRTMAETLARKPAAERCARTWAAPTASASSRASRSVRRRSIA